MNEEQGFHYHHEEQGATVLVDLTLEGDHDIGDDHEACDKGEGILSIYQVWEVLMWVIRVRRIV